MNSTKNSSQKNILLVSNNPLSTTRNNGKTLFSIFKNIKEENLHQLYFSSEMPTISKYSYYQLSDYDILNGLFDNSKRGRVITTARLSNNLENRSNAKKSIKKNSLSRLLREFMWKNKWKSNKLINWLNEFEPDIIFFVAGDSIFAYDIVDYIVKKYNSELFTYITDDYIMPRKFDNPIDKMRRNQIRFKMINCIKKSVNYFTISESMKEEYSKITGMKSYTLRNLTESMKISNFETKNKDIEFIYTGSLYYERDYILGEVAKAAERYNLSNHNKGKKINISVYCNTEPEGNSRQLFEKYDCCKYLGSLDPDELKLKLNKSDVLLFIESFSEKMIEKTKYSFSTKIPEYLSLGKPIFAVGPKEIGSMNFLKNTAICNYDVSDIYINLQKYISSDDCLKEFADLAATKYKEEVKTENNIEDILKYQRIDEE